METGTSVNALVREYLQDFAGADSAPTESLLEMALEMAVGVWWIRPRRTPCPMRVFIDTNVLVYLFRHGSK